MTYRPAAGSSGRTIAALILCAGLAALCIGCGSAALSGVGVNTAALAASESRTSAAPIEIRVPEASGTLTYESGGVTIDASNTADGYFMVKSQPNEKRLKLRVTCDGLSYDYDLPSDDSFVAFPCQMGDGVYLLRVMEQVDGSLYAELFVQELEVRIDAPNSPFLYPNQYVQYEASSAVVAKSYLLVEGLTEEEAIAKRLYRYVASNITYDYDKAASVQSGYLPDPDETLETGKGICFDYSALLAAMLRAQGIPTQLVIGVVMPEGVRHAWNRAFVDGAWMFMDATFDGSGHKESDYTPEQYY